MGLPHSSLINSDQSGHSLVKHKQWRDPSLWHPCQSNCVFGSLLLILKFPTGDLATAGWIPSTSLSAIAALTACSIQRESGAYVRNCISKIMMSHFTSSIKNYCRKIPFPPRDDYEVYLPLSKSLAVYSNKMAFPFIVAPDYPLCKENKRQLYYEVTLLNLCYHHRCSGNKLMSGK